MSCQSIPLYPSRPISVFISSRKTSMIPQEDAGYNLWALFCDVCVNLLFFPLKMISFSFFFFWPIAYGDLSSSPGIQPVLLALEAQSLNNLTTRKSLNLFFMARMGEQSVPLLSSTLLLVISSPLSCLFHTPHTWHCQTNRRCSINIW